MPASILVSTLERVLAANARQVSFGGLAPDAAAECGVQPTGVFEVAYRVVVPLEELGVEAASTGDARRAADMLVREGGGRDARARGMHGAELGALVLGGIVVGALSARTALLAAGVGPAAIGTACLLLIITRRRSPTAPTTNEGRVLHARVLFRGSFRVTYTDGPEEVVGAGEAYHLRPGHFVQTVEPVELIEISPAEEHDRMMATIARNIGLVASSRTP